MNPKLQEDISSLPGLHECCLTIWWICQQVLEIILRISINTADLPVTELHPKITGFSG